MRTRLILPPWRGALRAGCIPQALLLTATLLSAASSMAAEPCYDTAAFPSVARVTPVPGGVRAYLGGPDHRQSLAPTRIYSATTGWIRGTPLPTPRSHAVQVAACARELPPIVLPLQDARELASRIPADPGKIDQRITACQRVGPMVWFGLGFSEGRRVTGVGGLGRYDTRSRLLEVRRPRELRDFSASAIAVQGDHVWLGTTVSSTCSDQPPGAGVLVYDWKRARSLDRLFAGHGTCGLAIHDLAATGNALWIASELGVTRLPRKRAPEAARQARHFVPDRATPSGVREVACATLYGELLAGLPGNAGHGPFSQLFRVLAAHNPGFLATWALDLRHRLRSSEDPAGENVEPREAAPAAR